MSKDLTTQTCEEQPACMLYCSAMSNFNAVLTWSGIVANETLMRVG